MFVTEPVQNPDWSYGSGVYVLKAAYRHTEISLTEYLIVSDKSFARHIWGYVILCPCVDWLFSNVPYASFKNGNILIRLFHASGVYTSIYSTQLPLAFTNPFYHSPLSSSSLRHFLPPGSLYSILQDVLSATVKTNDLASIAQPQFRT